MMKKNLLIIVIALFAVIMFNSCSRSSTKEKPVITKEVTRVQYTCPMHPEVISDKPGNCPKCGMTLVEKK
jgi:membrane fusion protein, copper/silver efflux system